MLGLECGLYRAVYCALHKALVKTSLLAAVGEAPWGGSGEVKHHNHQFSLTFPHLHFLVFNLLLFTQLSCLLFGLINSSLIQNSSCPNKTRYSLAQSTEVTAAGLKYVVCELLKLTVSKYLTSASGNSKVLSCCLLGVSEINLSWPQIWKRGGKSGLTVTSSVVDG